MTIAYFVANCCAEGEVASTVKIYLHDEDTLMVATEIVPHASKDPVRELPHPQSKP